MKNRNNNKKKRRKVFATYTPGELVECPDGMHFYWPEWARTNGHTQEGSGRYFQRPPKGRFVKASPEGPLYKIIDIDGELFEIIHAKIKKVVDKAAEMR